MAQTAAQLRPELADMMEPIRDDLDQLVAALRVRPLTPSRYDELEEEWQRICTAGRAIFRGARR